MFASWALHVGFATDPAGGSPRVARVLLGEKIGDNDSNLCP